MKRLVGINVDVARTLIMSVASMTQNAIESPHDSPEDNCDEWGNIVNELERALKAAQQVADEFASQIEE